MNGLVANCDGHKSLGLKLILSRNNKATPCILAILILGLYSMVKITGGLWGWTPTGKHGSGFNPLGLAPVHSVKNHAQLHCIGVLQFRSEK